MVGKTTIGVESWRSKR